MNTSLDRPHHRPVLSSQVSSRQVLSRVATQLAFILFFFLSTLFIMPLFDLFVYDNDEGINVIKAVLMADGYPLYTKMWSDQPPIFTQLLQIVFALFGETMVAARLLVLGLATLFVWAYTSTIQMQLGTAAAWVALLLLMLSDNFLRLSVSVMVGLPALSFAMVAIYLLQRYKRTPQVWLILVAGLFMGLSIQTKVFTAILIPVIGLDLLDFGQDLGDQRALFWSKVRTLFFWAITTIVVYGLIGLYFNALNVEMLLGAHLNESVQNAYADENTLDELSNFLLYDYGHLLLALLGILAIAMRRTRQGLLPLLWLVVAVFLLVNHRPIWYHHYQLLSIPLCWLAAYGVNSLFEQSTGNRKSADDQTEINGSSRLVTALVALMLVGLIYVRGERTVPYYNQRSYNQEIVTRLTEKGADTQWVFADRAIYPFYAGLRVPPEIAVFSRKRFFGANLNNQTLLDVMQRYQPEQVLLTRFKDELLTDTEFAGYLDAHYTKVKEHPDYVYYRLE